MRDFLRPATVAVIGKIVPITEEFEHVGGKQRTVPLLEIEILGMTAKSGGRQASLRASSE